MALGNVHRMFLAGMCGAANFPAGRGKDENLRGREKVKIQGTARDKEARKLTDPKLQQKCVNSYSYVYL